MCSENFRSRIIELHVESGAHEFPQLFKTNMGISSGPGADFQKRLEL